MEDLRISIIIPVYNVEKYLAKCLDSILVGNAFTGQVICVNDGSTILCGVTIGENAMIGIGSVVTKDVPAREVWVGNPARFLKRATDNEYEL